MLHNHMSFEPAADFYSCIHDFAEMVEAAIGRIADPELVAPDRVDYRARLQAGSGVLEADMLIDRGLPVTIEAHFREPDVDKMAELAENAARAVQEAFTQRVRIKQFIARARKRAEALAAQAVKQGVHMTVADVRIYPIFLNAGQTKVRFELVVDETSAMLRTHRTWHRVKRIDDIDEVFAELTAANRVLRGQRRQAARALGAVGFVDAVTLRAIDATPEGRQNLLARVARVHELRRDVPAYGSDAGVIALRWIDGVVFGLFRVADRIDYDWGEMYLPKGTIASDAFGKPVADVIPHLAFANAIAEDAGDQWCERVRIVDEIFAFDAKGNVSA